MADEYPKAALVNGKHLQWVIPTKQGMVIFHDAAEEKAFRQQDAVPMSSKPEQHSQASYSWRYDPWHRSM